MNTTDLAKQIDILDKELSKTIKFAILAIIDSKIENEMSKYINEIKGVNNEIKVFKNTLIFKINTLIWVLGILFSLILAIAGFTIFK